MRPADRASGSVRPPTIGDVKWGQWDGDSPIPDRQWRRCVPQREPIIFLVNILSVKSINILTVIPY